MIDWGTLKTEIQEALLKDEAGTKYAPEALLTWAKWACTELAMHTAEAAQLAFACDGSAYQFVLPDNIVDNIEKSGLVGHDNGTDTQYLITLRNDPNTKWPDRPPTETTAKAKGYWEWPSGKLTLSFIPPAGHRIIVDYFRVWSIPTGDSSVLTFPLWAHVPFCYLVAAAAMGPKGVSASDIRQWNRKADSGNPEHNPLHRQAEFFLAQAKRILDKQGPQDRENFYQVRGPTDWKKR